MAFDLKKKQKTSTTPVSKENDFFFDLLVEQEWKNLKNQLKPDESRELIFKMGFIAGFRHLQRVIEIQTNNLRDSCGL